MDGFRRRQNESIAKDRSTMDERKEFFRQLGLPRFEVYDYAVRSFETPSFDLDYFEYRRHNLQRQNLSEDIIKKHLLNEVRNTLQEPTRSGSASFLSKNQNRNKVATPPPPPNISDFLPTINVEKNKPFKNNQLISSSNQRFQQTDSLSGYGNYETQFDNNINQNWLKGNTNNSFTNQQQRFGNNNDQFGNNINSERNYQNFQEFCSSFSQKNDNFGNQRFQETGSGFGHNNDQFGGNSINSQRMSSNQNFQQSSGSNFERNNDRFNNNNNNNMNSQSFQQQQSGSGFGFNNDNFGNNINSQRMQTNQGFPQSGSRFDNDMNSSRMSNKGFNFLGNNQNSQRDSNNWQETPTQSVWQTNTTQQFDVGTSNWNQGSMQSDTPNWGQNTSQGASQQNWSQGSNQLNLEQNNSSRGLSFSGNQNPPMRAFNQSNRDRNPQARGPPTNRSQNPPERRNRSGRDRNPPARGAPTNRSQNPPERRNRLGKDRNPPARHHNRSSKDRNPLARGTQPSNDRNSRPALQPKPKPITTNRDSSSKQNRRQNPTSMSNFQINDSSNNFNNNLGNFNDINFFPNNAMNPTDFNNFPINEPSLEEQVNGIVVQALQHISNTINQPMNQPGGLRKRMKAINPRKATLPAENPFFKQRTKSFEKQFKKFDCCILLSKRPKSDREDLLKGLSFLKNIKKRPLAPVAVEDDSTPAAKRLKQDDENEKDSKIEQESKNEQNSEKEKEIKTELTDEDEDSKPEDKEQNIEEHKFTFKRKNRNTQSLSQKKVETFTESIMPDERFEEFIKPEIYGDDLTKLPKRYNFKDYANWFKQYRWVRDHIMKVDDTDPSLRKIFFCSTHVPRKFNNDKIIECEKIIANALKIQEERFMHKEAYEFLKARTQYTEFLYVFKKSFLSHDGLRCLQKIYDHLLTANIVGFYKGIIEKFALTYGKNGSESKKPKNKELLADKAFNWLVGNAFKELRRMFNRSKLNERLNELYTFGCFIDKRLIENAKLLYKNYDYAHMDIKKLEELIDKKLEINWKNCREFMRHELRVSNDLYNKFLEDDEIIEKRKNLLEKLKTDPYVEKVHMYMARKLLNIYERIKYLESIHPRMIARQDLKQLIAFRKFLAVEDLKLMVKHIMDQWKLKYGKFTNPKYKKLFPKYKIFKNDDESNNNDDDEENDEDAEEFNDNDDDVGEGEGDEKNENLNEDNKETVDEDQTNENKEVDEDQLIEDEGGKEDQINEDEKGDEAEKNEDEKGDEAEINKDEGDSAQLNENGDDKEDANNIQENNPNTIDLVTDDEGNNDGGEIIDTKKNEVIESKAKLTTRGRGSSVSTAKK